MPSPLLTRLAATGNSSSCGRGLTSATCVPRRMAPLRMRCAMIGTSLAQVGTHHQHGRRLLEVRDAAAEQRCRRITRLVAEVDATQPVVHVATAEASRNPAGKIRLLQRRRRRHEETELAGARLADDLLQAAGSGLERGLPVHFAPRAVLANHRLLRAILRVEPLAAVAVAVGDPGLVDGLVLARHDAHQAAAQHVAVEIRARAVVRGHERVLRHFPGTRAITVRLVVEGTDRAQVDDVGGELVPHAVLDVGRDLHVLAASDRAEFLQAGDFLAEAHAARALDAARHVRGHERADVLVLHHALALGVARHVAPEAHREVLQLALAALVADRAVERVVDQQELHRRLLGRDGLRRLREDLHAFGDGRRAGRQRLRRLLDLDQAHAAVRRDRELVVVAEARHVRAMGVRGVDDHGALARLDRDAVDFDVDQLFAHAVMPRVRAPRRCCGRARRSTRTRAGNA